MSAVTVKLFGPEADRAGTRAVAARGATCGALRADLRATTPALAPSLDAGARFAVNGKYVADEHAVRAGDEIALIGMVSGG